ncbi:MAG TPA: 4'-phosphopantetheinyl transferase superfamily protein [Polyangiaceae bacterium]
MFERLLPADFSVSSADPRVPGGTLYPEEYELVARAVPKRRREFAKSRECAHVALGRLGFPAQPLLMGPRREPLWPEGAVGSITHTDSYCAAAVSRRDRYAGIGIDAECDEPLPAAVGERVCSREELREFEGAGWAAPGLLAKLAFSAKEAVYKCLFAEGRELELERIAIALREDGGFRARTAPPDATTRVFEGVWLRGEGLVLTAVWTVAHHFGAERARAAAT